MSEPRFLFSPVDADPARTLYVDGTEAGFRNLSHWPGNSTPPPLKRDLSTGIALAWAALAPQERERVLGPFDRVANNHYDTDGVLSCWVATAPDRIAAVGASEGETAETLRRAAATGDFGTWNGPDALALELTLMALPDHPGSPVPRGAPDGPTEAADARRKADCYRWAFQHLPTLLEDPFRHAVLWRPRFDAICADVERVERGEDLEVDDFPAEDLAVVRAPRDLTRIGLHHAAGDRSRVLLVWTDGAGTRYRFLDRVESWFELVSRDVPARVPLTTLVDALRRREGAAAGDPVTWWRTPLTVPVAQLGFSDPAAAGDGFSDDPGVDGFPPSRLPEPEVVAMLREALAAG